MSGDDGKAINKRQRQAIRTLVLLIPVLLTSCSKFHSYEVQFIVRDMTGKAIEGVGISGRGSQGEVPPVITDSEGKADSQFTVSFGRFAGSTGKYNSKTRITYSLSKTGYVNETIDVTPEQKPESSPEVIRVFVCMRPELKD